MRLEEVGEAKEQGPSSDVEERNNRGSCRRAVEEAKERDLLRE